MDNRRLRQFIDSLREQLELVEDAIAVLERAPHLTGYRHKSKAMAAERKDRAARPNEIAKRQASGSLEEESE